MDQEVVQILNHIADGHHFLLSGGAGSGKTYTLVQVIKEVLNKYHSRIACMTYTNAAANEIEQRVNHRDLNVSTIHDFLWDNIKNYQSELKQAVIALLNDPECKMHLPDSEEFVADDFFDNRENPTEIQYKEYLKIREGIISHDEVLMVANYMFANHKRLCDVVKSRYPFIFIDEYQDTHPEVISILLEHINKSEKKCIVGFFGDSMQAIYDDGIGDISKYLYNETNTTGIVYEIQKTQNRRCPLSVIQLANKLRNDGLEQQPSNDPKAPNMDEKGHVKQGSTMFYYSDEGINNLERLKENLIDEGWDFSNSQQTKELRLTHNLIADEAGFASLMDIHANDKILAFRDRVKKWITENDADYDFSSATFGQALDWLDTNHSGKKWKPTPEMEKYIECHNDAYNIARSINFAEFNKQYDKYFLFIERALNLLKPNGYLGYIVPSKFMKVGAAKELRTLIANNTYLKTIISFGAHQVFADKSTYTCIIVLEKKKHENFKYSEVSDFIGWRVRNINAYKFCYRPSNIINAGTWVLCTDEHLPLLKAVTTHTKPLGVIVGEDYIFNGIQTSANKVYVFVPISETRTTYIFKAFDGNEYEVEKAVTKPYFKTTQGADAMSTYRTFKPNARVFFPYKKDSDGNLQLIPLTSIQRHYPLFYAFLMVAKPELNKTSRDIQPKPTTADEWHRYGRHQSLEACEVKEKMIVGVLAQADKYAIDNNGTLVSSGGTAGYCLVSVPSDCQYSIYYIQAILGSIQGEWLASLYGEIFRGGYIARGTKVLKQIPIREIDFTNQNEKNIHDDIVNRQKRLIELGDKISKATKNRRSLIPLQRQFDLLKQEQQSVINKLYGMTHDEVSLIPKIKELYAAD